MTGNFTHSKYIPKLNYPVNCLFRTCSNSAAVIQELVLKRTHLYFKKIKTFGALSFPLF